MYELGKNFGIDMNKLKSKNEAILKGKKYRKIYMQRAIKRKWE